MGYEQIEVHLADLGAAPLGSRAVGPMDERVWREIGERTGGDAPETLLRLSRRFDGFRFLGGAFYRDLRYNRDVMVGWFLDGTELLETFEDTRDSLPEDVVPITNDGGDNHVAVGVGPRNAGKVYFHIHDAPTDSRLYLLSDSIEEFLMSLHREDENGDAQSR